MYVAINPSKSEESHPDVFHVGKIADLPVDATVKVQWYELEEVINENERYFKLGPKVEVVSVLSVYFSVNLNMAYDTEKKIIQIE